MKRIGLISDTHGYLDENIFKHFEHCDEIWHAGDFGSVEIAHHLATRSGLTVKGVYGNIDGMDVRSVYHEKLSWTCEEVDVFMIHIGNTYLNKSGKQGFFKQLAFADAFGIRPPKLFISGHSHILKIIFDDQVNCLYINPGAAGKQGWQKVRTIVTFAIDGNNITDCKVIELMPRW